VNPQSKQIHAGNKVAKNSVGGSHGFEFPEEKEEGSLEAMMDRRGEQEGESSSEESQ
jgi:hypothetical protein